MCAGMLWVVGTPLRVLMALASAGVAGVVAIFLTSPVRMRRLTAFLDPTLDLTGANHPGQRRACSRLRRAAGGE